MDHTRKITFIIVSQRPKVAYNLLATEEHYRALFYMPLYRLLHNLLNVLLYIANKIGL
jgi:hypothetical protein